jgi:hypothetical protein
MRAAVGVKDVVVAPEMAEQVAGMPTVASPFALEAEATAWVQVNHW